MSEITLEEKHGLMRKVHEDVLEMSTRLVNDPFSNENDLRDALGRLLDVVNGINSMSYEWDKLGPEASTEPPREVPIDTYGLPPEENYSSPLQETRDEGRSTTRFYTEDQVKVDERSGSKKADVGKLRYDLVPPIPFEKFVRILTHGASKYGDRNWEGGMDWSRIYASCQRHLNAWYAGQDIDPESGESHLAHAVCNLMFLLEYEDTRPEFDDRPIR